jgi:RNA polymerase sigma factor (sigma-70 family)
MMPDDSQLLAAYAQNRDPVAFGHLVERHIDFVYAAALRQTRDSHLSQDVTQAVFVLLSQRAFRLKPGILLKGWLFNATRYVVANARRADARRKIHEREAAAMRSEIPRQSDWSEISPHLDDAMAGLSEKDRRALLLRFFDDLPLEAVGQTLDISPNAAQKRVSRALDRVRQFLLGRGATVTGSSLGGLIVANAPQAAPAHLAKATIELATSSTVNAAVYSLAKGAAKMMSQATAKLLAIPCLAVATSIGIAVVFANGRSNSAPPATPPALTTGATTADSPDKDFQACTDVLRSIIGGYDNNDINAVQQLFYFKPGSDPKTVDVMNHILEQDVANYHLMNSAVARFGMHGTMLLTGYSNETVFIQDVLSRITPQDAQQDGDSLTILPPNTNGPANWPKKPLYFVRVDGVWKLDTARTFRITFQAKRRHPVVGETPQQTFAAASDLIAGHFDQIADAIDKGDIRDEVEAQRRISEAFKDIDSQFSECGCNTGPR